MTRLPESAFWLALAYASDLRLSRTKAIVSAWCLDRGQSLAALFELSPEELAAELELAAEEAQQISGAAGRAPDQAAWLAQLESHGVYLLTRADPAYPRTPLLTFPLAMQPLLLFWSGNLDILAQPSVAVIGAQDASQEMVSFGGQLAGWLAEEGLVVASGLGKGVGQVAFETAAAAQGGQAMGVLPMGMATFLGMPDVAEGAVAAAQKGQALLLSPFHPDAKFSQAQAVARNKLMVGLVEAVFAVTAGEAGTAREAAEEALRLGRAVYVWDEPTAVGNQALIQAGALPVTGVADILDAVEAIVTAALESEQFQAAYAELSDTPLPPLDDGAEAPYDPQAALDLLSKTGRVPEVLARRLREGPEP